MKKSMIALFAGFFLLVGMAIRFILIMITIISSITGYRQECFSSTFYNIKSTAFSNKRDIKEKLQLYYENYYNSDNGRWYNPGPCPGCTAKCEEMNNIGGQRNLPFLDCSRYQ
jgi:hypothetical protein